MSDSFWDNLPMLVTAIGAVGASLLGWLATLKGNRKQDKIEKVVEEVAKSVDGVVSKLVAAKDETAKEIKHAQTVADAKDAAYDKGKLSEMGKTHAKGEKEEPKIIEQVVEKQVVEIQDVKKVTPPKK